MANEPGAGGHLLTLMTVWRRLADHARPERRRRGVRVVQLKSIRFLETASGALVAPAGLYIRTERTTAVLGEEVAYAIAMPASQLGKPGCRSEPLSRTSST